MLRFNYFVKHTIKPYGFSSDRKIKTPNLAVECKKEKTGYSALTLPSTVPNGARSQACARDFGSPHHLSRCCGCVDEPNGFSSDRKIKTPNLAVECFYFGDPDGIRTRVTAVKGRCLRPLDHRAILVAVIGLEPMTLRV